MSVRGFRRPRCAACGLTPALCLCGPWAPLEARVAISVAMPRSEARAASGSARLARLWLRDSACYVQGDTGAGATLDEPGRAARAPRQRATMVDCSPSSRPAEPLPPRLVEFLERFPRPLVFTTGTGFGQPESFFDAAASCCEQLGMPGIFLSPFLKPDPQKLGERIVHFDHVELEGVLRHAALIIHHGGLGTTARALQAGIPQVISPMGFDQPDNGHRVELLGAGLVLPRACMSGVNFAAAVRILLSDAEIESRLSKYRAAIAPMRAIERCADLLERVSRNAVQRNFGQRPCA